MRCVCSAEECFCKVTGTQAIEHEYAIKFLYSLHILIEFKLFLRSPKFTLYTFHILVQIYIFILIVRQIFGRKVQEW
jgi:hypothetical protein